MKSYLKVLDTLCDKDIIKSYQDLSDNDKFMFIVKVKREFFENKSDDDILTILKLTETISDNLVLLDSNNEEIFIRRKSTCQRKRQKSHFNQSAAGSFS